MGGLLVCHWIPSINLGTAIRFTTIWMVLKHLFSVYVGVCVCRGLLV